MPTHSLVIEAEPAVCFSEITDYETFPEWQAAVKEVDVLSHDADGRGHDVGGDVRSIDGEYVFEDQGEGTTPTTYSLEIDPGVWLPGRVKRMLTDQVMKRSAEDLERRIESDS